MGPNGEALGLDAGFVKVDGCALNVVVVAPDHRSQWAGTDLADCGECLGGLLAAFAAVDYDQAVGCINKGYVCCTSSDVAPHTIGYLVEASLEPS